MNQSGYLLVLLKRNFARNKTSLPFLHRKIHTEVWPTLHLQAPFPPVPLGRTRKMELRVSTNSSAPVSRRWIAFYTILSISAVRTRDFFAVFQTGPQKRERSCWGKFSPDQEVLQPLKWSLPWSKINLSIASWMSRSTYSVAGLIAILCAMPTCNLYNISCRRWTLIIIIDGDKILSQMPKWRGPVTSELMICQLKLTFFGRFEHWTHSKNSFTSNIPWPYFSIPNTMPRKSMFRFFCQRWLQLFTSLTEEPVPSGVESARVTALVSVVFAFHTKLYPIPWHSPQPFNSRSVYALTITPNYLMGSE